MVHWGAQQLSNLDYVMTARQVRQMGWLWQMAWRDSRGSRRRLLLAMAAITVGMAACSAITAFDANLRAAVENQARALLGADMVLSSRQPFGPETEALLATLGGEQSREISCTSMAYFPKSGASRLVQVRALEGGFPYYGSLETAPPLAASAFRTGLRALVDDGLLLQVEAQVGETLQVGTLTLAIAGRLKKIPGEALVMALIRPRVYLPMAALQQTALLDKGSVVTYKVYIKLPPDVDADALLETLRPHLSTYRLTGDTVRRRAASVGRAMTYLSRFLQLVGFLAVLLGGIGVASAIQVYIKDKLATVAMLRCLGARAPQALAVYVCQAMALGACGALVGGASGLAVQAYLPRLLHDFLPVRLPLVMAWPAVLRGLGIGMGLVLLFALLPLLAVRQVTPWMALRTAYAERQPGGRDLWRWGVLLLLVGSIAALAFTHTERWTYGAGFCAALGVAFGLLTMVAHLLMRLVSAWSHLAWPYVWRQGMANLHRPQNQTLVLVLALGFGTCVLTTLYLTQHTLLRHVSRVDTAGQPNLLLFDIQSDQRDAVAALVRSYGLAVQQQVPFVTMRLESVKGRSTAELRAEQDDTGPEWAWRREYRATYREHLVETETLIAGTWQGRVAASDAVVPVSLEEDIARTLDVGLGDALVFDVQGVPISTIVGSLRRVDWQRVQPNVFVLFPAGVLEPAPQFHVLGTHAPSPALSAAVQRAIVQHFPNVSAIDVTLVLQTLDALVQKVAFAIRFMALFSIAAGIMVLTSAVLTSRSQRIRESVLLRTLGASRAQIGQILVLEYLFLGTFAAVTGLLLAVLASWALAAFLFEVRFVLAGLPLLVAFLAVLGLTVVTGLLGSRGITTQPPLAVLRREL
jgi:putative ABC transport system permease protein